LEGLKVEGLDFVDWAIFVDLLWLRMAFEISDKTGNLAGGFFCQSKSIGKLFLIDITEVLRNI